VTLRFDLLFKVLFCRIEFLSLCWSRALQLAQKQIYEIKENSDENVDVKYLLKQDSLESPSFFEGDSTLIENSDLNNAKYQSNTPFLISKKSYIRYNKVITNNNKFTV